MGKALAIARSGTRRLLARALTLAIIALSLALPTTAWAATFSATSIETNTAGTQIVVGYGVNLNAAQSNPKPANFQITVNGGAFAGTITSASVSTNAVTLTLAGASISWGQTVQLSYASKKNQYIYLEGGKVDFAENYTLAAVTNNVPSPDTVAPNLTSLATNSSGSQILLGYNEPLDASSVPAPGDFSVVVAGAIVDTTNYSIGISGSTVTLSLSNPILFGQGVTLSYTKPATGFIRDLYLNPATSFPSALVINNVVDATNPTLSSLTTSTDGTQVRLDYSEPLNESSVPLSSDFVLTIDGLGYSDPIQVNVVGSRVTLTLTDPISFGETVLLSYTQGAAAIQDPAGNKAASFSSQLVTNQVLDTDGPVLVSKTTDTLGTKVILTYNRTLDTTKILSNLDFQLKLNSSTIPQASTTVSFGSSTTVEIALTGYTIANDDVVTLSYSGNDIVASTNQVPAATFTDSIVSNLVPDTSPPVMISAATNTAGTQIIMKSSEPLDTTKPLESSAFTLKLDGVEYPSANYSAVLKSDGVDLILSTPIVFGQQVTIAYDNSVYKIYDLAGNFAASMPEQLIVNQVPDTQAPTRLSIATNTSGSQIAIRYSEELNTASVPVASDFALVVAGASYPGAITVSVTNDTVTLSLGTPLRFGQEINLSYNNAAANPIEDAAGNLAASFTLQVVENLVLDVTAPTVTTLSTNALGTQITLSTSEELAEITPAATSFTVLVNTEPVAVSLVFVTDSLVRLTLATAIEFEDVVTVAYTKPVSNPLQDLAGNQMATFTARSVTNNVTPSTAPQPLERAVAVDGLSLYGVYNRALDETSVPLSSEYVLKINGVVYSNTDYFLEVSGYRITMRLTGSAIAHNDQVLLSYTGSSLRDTFGVLAGTFTDYEMLNQVPDTTKPRLYSAVTSIDGSKIIMLSTETLATTASLDANAFTLTVDGVVYDRANIEVTLKSTGVDLTLTGPKLLFGQIITLAYSYQGETNKIFDLAGNFADIMPAQQIANLVEDLTTPQLASLATDVTGFKILATYNENLDASSLPEADSLELRISGVTYTGTITPSISGRVLTLTLSVKVAAGKALDLTYTPANTATKLQDLAGNDALGLFQAVVVNAVSDVTGPVAISKNTNSLGTQVRIRFDEQLNPGSVPAPADFQLRVNGLLYASSNTSVQITEDLLVINLLGPALSYGQSITLSYVPGANPIEDLASNPSLGFTGSVVANVVTAPVSTAPQLTGKVTSQDGRKVILTYDQSLNTTPIPAETDYFLRINGTRYESFTVTVSGLVVELNLTGSPILFGDAVTLAYSGSSLIGLDGSLPAAGFTEKIVSNLVPDLLPPQLLAATTDGNGDQLILLFDESLASAVVNPALFTVFVEGVPYIADLAVAISGTEVFITLAASLSPGQQVLLDYDGNVLADTSGNPVPVFDGVLVTNVIGDTTPPVISLDASARTPQGTTAVAQATANEPVTFIELSDEFGYFVINPATGVITADPLAELGTYNYQIRATDSSGNTSSKTIAIEIYVPDYGYPVISLSAGITLQTGTVNVATATANEPVTWSETIDASGYFSIDAVTGQITAASNTPAGTYSYSITATDSDEFESDATILITFRDPTPPPTGSPGVPVTPVVLPIATTDTPVTAAVFPGQPVVIGARIETNNASDPYHQVFVTMPGDLPIELRLSISPAITKNQVALGFMTLVLTACDCDGVPYRDFTTPLEINLGKRIAGTKIVHSEDGLTWNEVPLVQQGALPANLRDGYYLNQMGEIVILTNHLSFFGLKLEQPEVVIETKYKSVVESSHFVVNLRGGAGLGEEIVRSLTPKICQPVDNRRINTLDDGVCQLVAEHLGDGIYLPQLSEVFSFEVKKRFVEFRSVGSKKLISFSLGEKYANQVVKIQIKRAGSSRYFTARTVKLTSTGVGWKMVTRLQPGDVVRIMNPGVTYLTKTFR